MKIIEEIFKPDPNTHIHKNRIFNKTPMRPAVTYITHENRGIFSQIQKKPEQTPHPSISPT